jgi:AraC-like DNA-binding protein
MRGTAGHRPVRPGVIASRQGVVDQAETYLRAHLDTHVPLSRLCRLTGLSERGLRNAFYGVHGVGPKRWMLAARLRDVRRALIDARGRPATVTGVAAEYGFYELGRFAAAYKAAFGEAPSKTLHGGDRPSVPPRVSDTGGHTDGATS